MNVGVDDLVETKGCTGQHAPKGLPDKIPASAMYCDGDLFMNSCSDYVGSLYQKLVRYAMQACVRPSNSNVKILPTVVLADVNTVMDSIRVQMSAELAKECDRLGGSWVNLPCLEDTCVVCTGNDAPSGCKLSEKFYDETGANLKWGYCAHKAEATTPATPPAP
jgi:hypothetical protein